MPPVFGNNAEMRNMWLWQDVTNNSQITWNGGGATTSTCPTGAHTGTYAGLAYAPSADVTFRGTEKLGTGTLLANEINPGGNNNVIATGYLSC
jgi:hypothetical protein